MIDFIANNWFYIIILVAILVVIIRLAYQIIKDPSSIDLSKVQEWLLWAVMQAEKQLGGGTGQLKLRYVYDMFVARFPTVSKILTFEAFSIMVDIALAKLNEMLANNKKVQQYVYGVIQEEK